VFFLVRDCITWSKGGGIVERIMNIPASLFLSVFETFLFVIEGALPKSADTARDV